MKNNKLIAEFMGAKTNKTATHSEMRKVIYDQDYWLPLLGIVRKDNLKYHTSWDWLMPVAEKCLTTDENTDGQHYFINDSLLTCNIEEVYDRVVGFINEYNKIK